ncbi:ATP:cob(I)alamin adenosyltransferase [Deinococcus sp. 6GRE01]|uniref:ATP:cob(I)alamin adenosyltransferase n=1 Tax=Deinococcus sp. 6GRE01 TaxID=2745873 RepID=UPI001E4D8870|nr:ATP:cob(I)alamin adenosyltransferase [Deinococcus sp. 6GRE01]MCD0156910.1 hypothetical protein [Deinococcus sp. 6GRE01]
MTPAPICAQCDAPHAAPFTHDHGAEEMLCPACRLSVIEHQGAEAYIVQVLARALGEWLDVYSARPGFLTGSEEEAAHQARTVMRDLMAERRAP